MQAFARHLRAFDGIWTNTESGICLPKHVTEELQQFLTCGILSHGFAQMHCDVCRKRHLVAFSCKGRGSCPSCMGRRMNEGAANLVDHVLPTGVPIRQWVLTLPHPLRYPLAFDPTPSYQTTSIKSGPGSASARYPVAFDSKPASFPKMAIASTPLSNYSSRALLSTYPSRIRRYPWTFSGFPQAS